MTLEELLKRCEGIQELDETAMFIQDMICYNEMHPKHIIPQHVMDNLLTTINNCT